MLAHVDVIWWRRITRLRTSIIGSVCVEIALIPRVLVFLAMQRPSGFAFLVVTAEIDLLRSFEEHPGRRRRHLWFCQCHFRTAARR